jgi:acyl carrier protein
MNKKELREFAIKAVGRSPEKEPENPQFDSLDKLEIISAVYDQFGDEANSITELDNFSDLETLFVILKESNLVD